MKCCHWRTSRITSSHHNHNHSTSSILTSEHCKSTFEKSSKVLSLENPLTWTHMSVHVWYMRALLISNQSRFVTHTHTHKHIHSPVCCFGTLTHTSSPLLANPFLFQFTLLLLSTSLDPVAEKHARNHSSLEEQRPRARLFIFGYTPMFLLYDSDKSCMIPFFLITFSLFWHLVYENNTKFKTSQGIALTFWCDLKSCVTTHRVKKTKRREKGQDGRGFPFIKHPNHITRKRSSRSTKKSSWKT